MRKRLYNSVFILIVFIFLILSNTHPVFAQDNLGLQYGSDLGLGNNDPITIVVNLIKLALSFLGLIAVIIIMAGGFRWMTAGGNEDAVAAARSMIINGIIGIIIVLAAWGIASWLINTVSSLTIVK